MALTLIAPAIVTSPLASITTGVLVVFFLNVTVTPEGMFTVVKLNIPPGGSGSSVFTVGLNAPSAPVLPLLNAYTGDTPANSAAKALTSILVLKFSVFI